MTTFILSGRQAETLADFARELHHDGPIRLSVDPSNSAGAVLRAELLEGEAVTAIRLLHRHGSYTPSRRLSMTTA